MLIGLTSEHNLCGFFLNYLGTGTSGQGYMSPFKPLISVENCTASFVGDGDYHTVQMHGDDVGKFVAAGLNLDKWSEISRMAGDRKTVNEIIALAEAVRGMSVLFHCNPTKIDRVLAGKKFDVTHLTVDEVKSQYVQSPPFPVANIVKQGRLVATQSPERCASPTRTSRVLSRNISATRSR